jgi:hypothetical protein
LKLLLLFAAVAACLVGQSAAPDPHPYPLPYPIPMTQDWTRAVEAGTRTTSGEPGPAWSANTAAYRIVARLDPVAGTVAGTMDVTYKNRSPATLDRLVLHLRQNLHAPDAQRNVDVEVTGGIELGEIKARKTGQSPWSPRTRVNGTLLTVRLGRNQALRPGDEITLSMGWSFKVPGKAPRMGHEDHRVYYLGYWYPQFAVHDDVRGWVADPYLGGGEFYMGYADYDVTFSAPAGWLVRATGDLLNPEEVLTPVQQERLASAMTTRDVVHVLTEEEMKAGQATAESDAPLEWRFEATNVRDFAISVSDRYVWDATHADIPDGSGGRRKVLIQAVYEPDARFWSLAAEFCRHTVEFMSERFLPYPWPHMTCCEGIVRGGMEFPMMTDIGTYPTRASFYEVVSHETIHMWWPMIAGSNEKEWAWMDEGITSFVESLCSADYMKRRSPWIPSMGSYRMMASRGEETPVMRHADQYPDMMAYVLATYEKTPAVLHQLRWMLGEETFDRALATYTTSWAWKHPYPRDLFNVFNRVSGRDLDWYWRTWLYDTGTLDLAVRGVTHDDAGSRITLENRGLAMMEVDVRVTYADGTQETLRVGAEPWRQGLRSTEVPCRKGVTEVQIDPDRRTLDVNPRNNRWKP